MSHQLAGSIRVMEKEWAQFCLIDHVGYILDYRW